MVDRRRPGDPAPPPIQHPILQSAVSYGVRNRTGRFNMPGSGSRTRPSPFIPTVDWSGQLSPNASNNAATDPASIQMMHIAQDDTIPVLYGGPEMMAGLLYFYGVYQLQLVMVMILCEGEIAQIGSTGTIDGNGDLTGLRISDVATTTGVLGYKYRGTNTQNINTMLQALIPTFDEDLRGTAYVVYQCLQSSEGVPRLTIPVYGRLLFDPRCNLLKSSNDFNSSNWGKQDLVTITAANQNAVGPYGATAYAWTITDSSANTGILYQNITGLGNNSSSYVVSLKICKVTGGAQTGFDVSLSGGSPVVNVSARIMPETGSTSGSSAGVSVEDLGTWWRLSIPITNNSSGNTTLQMAIYPAALNAAATGTNFFCEAQVRHSVRPLGYIETTSSGIDQPTQFSTNTALELGDFLASSVYGEGRTVNQDSLGIAAEFCDQILGIIRTGTYSQSGTTITVTTTEPHGLVAGLWFVNFDFTSGAGPDGTYAIVSVPTRVTFTITVGVSQTITGPENVTFWTSGQNEKRSTATLLLDTLRSKKEWRDVIRSYIPAWVNDVGDESYIRVDTLSATVDHTLGDNDIDITDGVPVFNRAGASTTPNVVTVSYTDTTVYPWKTATATTPDSIPNPARRTRIDMPGIRSYSQAKRYAIERLNHYATEDLTGEFDVFDIGVKILPGDLISLTYSPLSITSKWFRVLGVADKGHGRWKIRVREYQSNAYSNLIQTTPLIPDIAPPDINTIPDVTGLTLSADRVLVSGTYASRIKATWNPETVWPYVGSYFVEMFNPEYAGPTYSISGNVVTVTWNNHGQYPNMPIYANFTSSSGAMPADGWYTILSVLTNTFTFTLTHANVSGNVSIRILRDSGEVTLPTWLSVPVQLDVSYMVRVRIRSTNGKLGAIS